MSYESAFSDNAKDRPAGRGLQELLATEGRPWYSTGAIGGTTIADGTSLGSLSLPNVTQAVWIENLVISSNRLAALTIDLPPGGAAGLDQRNLRPMAPAGSTIVIPVRTLIRPSHLSTAGTSTTIGSMQISKALDTTLTTTWMWATAEGTQIYDDLHYSAKKVILWVGDSVNAGTGITAKTKGCEWGVRQFLRAQGNDVRLSNRSIGSTTTAIHESFRNNGHYDATKPDLIVYSLGINDAIGSSSSVTNAQAFMDWKQTVFPNAKLLMVGPTGLNNNTNETTLATYRSNLSAAVTAENDPNISYLSLLSAFDRTTLSNYGNSTDGVHPNDASHAAMLALYTAKLTALGWDDLG